MKMNFILYIYEIKIKMYNLSLNQIKPILCRSWHYYDKINGSLPDKISFHRNFRFQEVNYYDFSKEIIKGKWSLERNTLTFNRKGTYTEQFNWDIVSGPYCVKYENNSNNEIKYLTYKYKLLLDDLEYYGKLLDESNVPFGLVGIRDKNKSYENKDE